MTALGNFIKKLLSSKRKLPLFNSNQGSRVKNRVALYFITLTGCLLLTLVTLEGGAVIAVMMFAVLPQILACFIEQPKLRIEKIKNNSPSETPTVTVVISAKNEEAVLSDTLCAVLALDYDSRNIEIVVIDDDSTDSTADIVLGFSKDHRHVRLHRRMKKTGLKAGGLNEIFPFISGQIILLLDADAIVQPDLLQVTTPLFVDAQIGAVNATLRCRNYEKGLLTNLIHNEYSFYSGSLTGGATLIRHEAWKQCGGWNESALTEDFYMTISLISNRWKIVYPDTPPVSILAPEKWRHFFWQRCRWALGDVSCLCDYFYDTIRDLLTVSGRIPNLSYILVDLLTLAGIFYLSVFAIFGLTPWYGAGMSFIALILGHGIRNFENLNKLNSKSKIFQALFFVFNLHISFYYIFAMIRIAISTRRLDWQQFPHH